MIIDCIPFFDELDVLEIRLRELSDVVDRFVICEATRTFSNLPKPLYFDDNRTRYAEFLDRIDHVVIDKFDGLVVSDTWSMDWGQKQRGIEEMLQRVTPDDDDLILITDCDEVPRAESVIQVAENTEIDIATPLMPIFYYWLNCRQIGPYERMAKWVRRSCLDELGTNAIRLVRTHKNWGVPIKDAGWHFSYIGDISRKINSWAHSEYNGPPYNTPEHIARCKEKGLDLFNRDRFKYTFLDDLSYLPQCVLDDVDKWSHLLNMSHEPSS